MMDPGIPALLDAISHMHGCEARWVESVPVNGGSSQCSGYLPWWTRGPRCRRRSWRSTRRRRAELARVRPARPPFATSCSA